MTTSKPQWHVYIVRCSDHSLYAGITTDIERRIHEHNTSEKGAKYTRCRRPVTLAYALPCTSRSTASKEEYKLKKLSKKKKEQLISAFVP